MIDRISALRNLVFDKTDCDAILISSCENIYYFSQFTGGTDAKLLITKSDCYIYTDSRYYIQAKEECLGFELIKATDTLEGGINKHGINKIAIEDEVLSVKEYNALSNKYSVELIPVSDIIFSARMVKDKDEIDKISKAAEIADKAFSYILTRIKPGVSEKQIAIDLETYMKMNGADGLSFDTIVASGIRSAMPHGTASDKIIETGDFVTLDYGCIYKGYCSDMTRTVAVGEVSSKQTEVYDIVLEAQLKALDAIKAGICAKDLDKVARDVITGYGYGEYFTHSLGHGVGLAIHEAPSVSFKNEMIICENAVITDEPGVYIDGEFGVRIEDLVLVCKNNGLALSHSDKKLIVL